MKLDDDWIQEFLAPGSAQLQSNISEAESKTEDVLVHPSVVVGTQEVPSGMEGKSLLDILADEYLDLDDELMGDLEMSKPQVDYFLQNFFIYARSFTPFFFKGTPGY